MENNKLELFEKVWTVIGWIIIGFAVVVLTLFVIKSGVFG